MPRATFTLQIPEVVWIGELSRSHPETVFRVLAAIPGEENVGAGLVEIRSSAIEEVLAAFGTYDAVTDLEVMRASEDEALVQFETDQPLLLLPVRETGVPLQTPFDILDGEVTWVVTAAQNRLTELASEFDSFGIPYEVEELRQEIDSERLLSDPQSELVTAALERGYYDTPRECTLTELAEELEMAPSTVSETLHRAEERIIKEVMVGPQK